MRMAAIILSGLLVLVVIGMLVCAAYRSDTSGQGTPPVQTGPVTTAAPLRLALIPERNIFAQRQRYQTLADDLAEHLDRRIELVSLNTYESVLDEFEQKHIDGAFVGSMLAVLAYERLGTVVLVKPVHPDGVSTYTGVIIVRDDSPISDVAGLAGKSIAMVRTTTAGNLFPIYLFHKNDMLTDAKRPIFRWVGTHDEVINEVLAGNVDAGAVKNLRLEAYLAEHPEVRIRRLATGDEVPDNGLIVSGDMPADQMQALREALLKMDQDERGRAALKAFGSKCFAPCRIEDYQAVYRMVEAIGPAWDQLGVAGPAPKPLTPGN